MKKLILISFAIAFLNLFETAKAHDPSTVHGMVLFGTHKIYLSHLPLFHSPHDYQALFEVTLDAPSLAAYQAKAAEDPDALFTISPQRFVLPEMASNPEPFRASLFHGHFERGGKEMTSNARITITRVLFFEKFKPGIQKPRVPSFFLLGNEREQFLVHEIFSPPDFDQIVRVTLAPNSLALFLQRDFQRVQVSTCAHYQPVEPGLEVLLEGDNDTLIDAALGPNLYLETNELRE